MRWGDDGADGGDDVDDDPDYARRDGDDDGSDFPLREGISLGRFLPARALLLSIWFPPRRGAEKSFEVCPDVFRSKASNTPKGCRRGP